MVLAFIKQAWKECLQADKNLNKQYEGLLNKDYEGEADFF